MIPLVLLPGMMCDARLFGPQIGALSGNQTLHIPPLTRADTMESLAANILQNAPPFFSLAGLSMGGIVGMEILRQAPDRVVKLALMDTNPLAETAEMQARRLPQIQRVKAGGLEDIMRDEMKPLYLADTPNRVEILDLCMAMALGLGPDVFAMQSRALADRPDQTQTIAAFKGPALVLMGEHDILCPRDRHELMHDLMPQSRFAIIAGAGHLPVLEKPAETTAELLRWLEE